MAFEDRGGAGLHAAVSLELLDMGAGLPVS